jgi:hypothetical protein
LHDFAGPRRELAAPFSLHQWIERITCNV